jgi:DNA-binding MarR family transcriptional regulator
MAAMAPRRKALLVLELQRATHAVGLHVEAALADLGVSQGEAHVLALLAGGAPRTVGELQRGLHHRASTLSGILDRLEGRGLVGRSLNRDDRRSLLVTLTRRGEAAAERVVAELRALERAVAQRVGAEELAGFRAVAAALAQPLP